MSSRDHRELQPLIGDGRKRRGCCTKHPYVCSGVLVSLILLSLAVVVFGAVFGPKLDQTVQDAIGQHVKLENGSTATAEFAHSSAPLYTTYYLFNITNPEQFKNGSKPILKEIGPYAYKENRQAFDMEWRENGTILRYNTNITYTFDPERSNGHPNDDLITTINVPLFGIFKALDGNSTLMTLVREVFDKINEELGLDPLIIRCSVTQLLWGYEDPILSFLHKYHNLSKYLPDENPIFGFGELSSIEAPNEVYTGVDDLSKVAQYIQWNGNYTMSAWDNPYAEQINGTGGYSFHPGISRDETLLVFIDELFRSGYFKYSTDIIDHGIRLYKFVLPDDELKNTTQKAAGFPGDNPDGVLDMSKVVSANVPIFASKPHFLHADPVFRQDVVGMKPDPSKHDSYLAVEPITGAVMNAAKRIQVNLHVLHDSQMAELKHLQNGTMLPIYYAEQAGAVTAELANEFKNKVFIVRFGVMGSLWAVMGLAGLTFLVCVMCLAGVVIQQCRLRRLETQIQYNGGL